MNRKIIGGLIAVAPLLIVFIVITVNSIIKEARTKEYFTLSALIFALTVIGCIFLGLKVAGI